MSNIIEKIAWLHIQDHKLLVARTKDISVFYLPEGERQTGETSEDTLQRAIQESFGTVLVPSSIKSAGTFCAQANKQAGNVQVQLHCFFANHDGEPTPNNTIEELDFIGFQERSNCSAAVIIVMQWLYEQGLIN